MTWTRPRILRRSIAAVLAPLALLACVGAAGCARGGAAGSAFSVREITPAFLLARAAADPTLAADARGTVALVWVSRESSLTDVWLAVSHDSGATFSPPVRVNQSGTVVSFPETRPAVALGPGGALAVAWSERRSDSSGAVDLRARASADFGRSFGAVTTVNDDAAGPPPGLRWRQARAWPLAHRPDAFHGFATLTFTADGSLLAVWLDNRRTPAPEPARLSTLWRAISSDGGQTWGANLAVSDSACPCCRPSLVRALDDGVALGFRSGTGNVRDPRLAVSRDGGRAFAIDSLIARDGWRTPGCPDQGPALTWDRPDGGHYVWFTGADPPGVYVVRWRRDGDAGPRRPVADSLAGTSHPVAVPLGEGMLIGLEARVPQDTSHRAFAVRALEPGGAWSDWTMLGADATSGALATAGASRALACWIEHEPQRSRLRLAALTRRTGVRP